MLTKIPVQKKSTKSSLLIKLFFVISLIAILGVTACTNQQVTEDSKQGKTEDEKQEEKNKESVANNDKQEDKKEKEQDEQKDEIDYQEVQPNELGDVMILMYHRIGDEEDDWERTRENFREDLERLYEKDYRLVNLMDVVEGEIDLPAGKTPVVLTFDDATSGQFGYKEKDGEQVIDPDTAVGIIMDMKEEYEDFTVGGTFYVNYLPVPFRDQDLYEDKIAHLDELGFEIGNHGYNHLNLQDLDAEEIQKELALPHKYTEEIISDYNIESHALAFGAWPGDDSQEEYVYEGEYDGITYEHEAILNVGAEPAHSPFHSEFDPLDLPRVRADQDGMDQWLGYYEDNPHKRYVSDGRTDTITVPEELEDELDQEFLEYEQWEITTYSINGNDENGDE